MTEGSAAARLRSIRQEMGNLSQKAAADAIGVSEATWQRMESGDGLPKGETLLGLAKAGFSPTWVMLGQGPMRLADAESATAPASAAMPDPKPAEEVTARTLDRYVDFDSLDWAFRDALRRAQIPESAVKDPHTLMLLTVALYDTHVIEGLARSKQTAVTTEEGRRPVSATRD